jgi:hypothetical protein
MYFATKPPNRCTGLCNALLIGRNHFPEVFRVHASGERGRPDEVTEHHRDLAALGAVFES